MEEVWKEINLASLPDHPSPTKINPNTATNHFALPPMTLQDFLSRPFRKDPSSTSRRAVPTPTNACSPPANTDFFDSLPLPPPPPPPIVLSLNSASGSDFQYLDSSPLNVGALRSTPPHQLQSGHVVSVGTVSSSASSSCFNHNFDAAALAASSSSSSSYSIFSCKKRLQENDDNYGDGKNKRMIKNRESAARSRARKQESLFL